MKLLKFHSIVVYIFLYLPILLLVVFSFNTERINAVWSGFTLSWYIKLWHDTEVLHSIKNSIFVGIISTLFSTILGTIASFSIERYKFRNRNILEALLHLPIIVPDIVIAISLLLFYVLIKLTLGLFSIIIAHITFNIAFVTAVVRTRLVDFDWNLEKAAKDLGATSFQTFRYIILPIIFPGIIAASLLAFTLSWDDFLIAFFTSGVGATTLPLKVYSMIKFGVSPEVNAISTITLFVSFTLFFSAMRILGKMKNII